MSGYLFHMCPADTWSSLKQSSTSYFPPTFESDGGFINLTADPSLLLQVGNHFYKGDPGNWTLLVIDSNKLTSEVSNPHPPPPPLIKFNFDYVQSSILASILDLILHEV